MSQNRADDKVVFFDGECGLCDRFVRFLIKVDRRHVLRFATLQGETSRETFGEQPEDPENWSIKYVDENGVYHRSTAALKSIAALGGVWKLALVLFVFPALIRDAVYRFVATHRYKWFGKLDSCMLPSPALKERFLP